MKSLVHIYCSSPLFPMLSLTQLPNPRTTFWRVTASSTSIILVAHLTTTSCLSTKALLFGANGWEMLHENSWEEMDLLISHLGAWCPHLSPLHIYKITVICDLWVYVFSGIDIIVSLYLMDGSCSCTVHRGLVHQWVLKHWRWQRCVSTKAEPRKWTPLSLLLASSIRKGPASLVLFT